MITVIQSPIVSAFLSKMFDVGDLPVLTCTWLGNWVLKAEWLSGLWNYMYVFLRFLTFFSKSKKHDFLCFFWVVAHVFPNSGFYTALANARKTPPSESDKNVRLTKYKTVIFIIQRVAKADHFYFNDRFANQRPIFIFFSVFNWEELRKQLDLKKLPLYPQVCYRTTLR